MRARLTRFLHPLTGGRDGRGWDFGEAVYLSDVAALIEDTPGVDAVRFLQLMVGQASAATACPSSRSSWSPPANSQLKIVVPSVPYALA